jgi:putative flippase GtrA
MIGAVHRVARFIVVGCAAAAVHFAVVLLLVGRGGLAPLVANVGGWIVAVGVSFAGHRFLTFVDQRAPLGRSALRFAALSAAGFAVNESAYALLLGASGLGYRSALALVLVGVAVFTYWLGRHWAFLGSPTASPSPRSTA